MKNQQSLLLVRSGTAADQDLVRALRVPGRLLATHPWREPDQVWPPDRWLGLFLLAATALSYRLPEKPIIGLKHRLQA